MPKIKTKQGDFYYEIHGEGFPLVLIAGYTCSHHEFALMTEALARKYQVLVFDNRGSGESCDANENLSAESMAQDLISIVDALDIEKFHLVGQSMGGTIAQAVAYLFPDKVEKLVLMMTTAKWRQATIKALRYIQSIQERNGEIDEIINATLPWVFSEDYFNQPKQVEQWKEAIVKNPHPQSLENQKYQFAALQQFDSRKFVKDIQCPTLVICGCEDILSLPIESKFLAESIPNASLLELHCGHAIPIEQPDIAVKSICEFLEKIRN
jgi:3-oxoadipate enol-lactonase